MYKRINFHISQFGPTAGIHTSVIALFSGIFLSVSYIELIRNGLNVFGHFGHSGYFPDLILFET